METGKRWYETVRKGAIGATVVAAVALLAAPLAASAANGGVIRFVGMIVAPQLTISADATPGIGDTSVSGQGRVRTVTFSASPGVGAGAHVALEVNGSAAVRDLVTARFVDGNGHAVAADDGHFDVSRTGGVLSLTATRMSTQTRVAVLVSYE